MKRNGLILGFCILLLGCSDSPPATDNPPPTKTPATHAEPMEIKPTVLMQYWDGWPYLDQPVFRYTTGPSVVAHNDFIKCGLGDDYIEDAVRSHVATSMSRISKKGIAEVNSKQTPIWEVGIEVTELTPDIFLVICSGKRP